jgi:hypothetical protein
MFRMCPAASRRLRYRRADPETGGGVRSEFAYHHGHNRRLLGPEFSQIPAQLWPGTLPCKLPSQCQKRETIQQASPTQHTQSAKSTTPGITNANLRNEEEG